LVLVLEILEDGKVLCKDPDFHSYILQLYRDVRRKFARRGKVWMRID